MWQQQQDQHIWKMIHNVCQEDDLHVGKPNEQHRSFDGVRVKFINLDSEKSVIFTKLESSTS